MSFHPVAARRSLSWLAFAVLLLACKGESDTSAGTSDIHKMPASARQKWSAPFVASRDRPFPEQMMETMARMNDGMSKAPMSSDPDRDFVTMMIPHHQGGIDMAKVLLIHGKDPEMRRLAQAIITDQQNEIELMHLWLRRHGCDSEPSPLPAKETGP